MGDLPLPNAVTPPGQPPTIITRAQWGADESMKCPNTVYDNGVRAGIVHHTAGSNDYGPQDSAAIVRSIYAYHTRTLGWCDIAYNALVDKYGQVFEGRAGGIDQPVEGSHTGGFNKNTWGVAMLGNFDVVPPTPIQLRTVGRLLGWRLGMDRVDPRGTVVLTSDGGSFTHFPRGATPTLPTIFTHRDVGITDCPGNAAYAVMDQIRDIAARFNEPLRAAEPDRPAARRRDPRQVGDRWAATNSPLGAPTITGGGRRGQRPLRHLRQGRDLLVAGERRRTRHRSDLRRRGRRSATSAAHSACRPAAKFQEPQWIVQNFQHGTLNFDRENGTVTRVIDGVPEELPPPSADGPPVQLERFKPIDRRASSRLEPPAFQHAGHTVVGVGRGDLVGGLDRLGMGIAHRHAETGPPQHRHVVGHVAERHHVVGGDPEGRATSSTPVALLMPSGTTSIRPLLVE